MFDKYGILHSDIPEQELPNQHIWKFLYPKLQRWSDLTAFIDGNETSITYSELINQSLCWAKELREHQLGSEPITVSFALNKCIDYFPLILGTFAAGATVNPLKEDCNTELFQHMLTQIKPKVIVMDPSIYELHRENIVKSELNMAIYIRGQSSYVDVKEILQVLKSGDALAYADTVQYDSSAAALKVFSSGTTGNPKCIVISHKAITNAISSLQQKEVAFLTPADDGGQSTIFGHFPMSHIFGLEHFAIYSTSLGCKIVYVDGNNVNEILPHVIEHKPELIRVFDLDTLAELSKLDDVEPLKCIKTILFAGCTPNIEDFLKLKERLGNDISFQECYGCTECNGIAMSQVGVFHPEMTGKLLSHCKAKFVDQNTGNIITEPQKYGEIFLKSAFMMDCYLNKPEVTKEAHDSDGWYRSGDIGYFDERHFIKVIGRSCEDITVIKGDSKIKIYPGQIESVIKQHPAVADVGVTGFPDFLTGAEKPKALVIRKMPVMEEEIISFVHERVPEELRLTGGLVFVKSLPRNNMGKMMRTFLKEDAWSQ